MRSFTTAASLVLALAVSTRAVGADRRPSRLRSYDDMRATLDDLMTQTKRIADLLTAFGGADEMSPQDMTGLETQVRNIFPEDFENAALMMRQEMENGFAQELIAYWTGVAYIYVRVLWHQRPEGECRVDQHDLQQRSRRADPAVLRPQAAQMFTRVAWLPRSR
jgi:hypothetical protein